MKLGFTALALALLTSACAVQGGTINIPTTPPATVSVRAVGVVVTDAQRRPVAGAVCGLDGGTDQGVRSNADGYILFATVPASLRATQLVCAAEGHLPFSEHRDLQTGGNEDLPPAVLTPALRARHGAVRAAGRAFADEDGPYLGVGASLFWGAWGCEHDPARLARNLAWLKAQRVDYVRVIAIVGPTGWADRTAPAAGVEARVACTAQAAARAGVRVAWSIFGNVDTAPTPGDREHAVRAVSAGLAPYRDTVQSIEIGNEAWQTGFAGAAGIAELRQLAAILRSLGWPLVSLTSPQTDQDIAALYDGSPATLMGVHPDRNVTGQGGIWRPVRQAWDYRDSRILWTIDEPIGQKSTVADDFDPTRQAMAAANGWVTGAAAYVVHAGAGIRGGGREDLDRGREANWDDVPGAAAVFAAINAIRDILPADLPNFQHHNAGWATYPFDSDLLTKPAGSSLADRNGYLRAFAATAGDGRLVVLPMLVVESLPLRARRPMHLEVHDPRTGALLEQVDLAAGQTFTLTPRDAAVLVGR